MIDFWQQFFVIRLESERFTVKLKKISFNFAIWDSIRCMILGSGKFPYTAQILTFSCQAKKSHSISRSEILQDV